MNKEAKRLKNFLRGKKLLTRFKLHSRNPKSNPLMFDEKYNLFSVGISGAFIWSQTPEGKDFWYKLEKEFDELITSEDVKENQRNFK